MDDKKLSRSEKTSSSEYTSDKTLSATRYVENHHRKETITSSSGDQSDHHMTVKSDKSTNVSHDKHINIKKPHTGDKISCTGHTSKDNSILFKQTVVSTTTTTDRVAASSDVSPRPIARRIVQSFRLIWLDQNINETKEHFQKCLGEFRRIIFTLEHFTNTEQAIKHIKSITKEKIFVIVSGTLGQQVVPLIHDIVQVDTIVVFCVNKERHKRWAKDWPKIEGVHGSRNSICQILSKATQATDHNSISISFLPKTLINAVDASKDKNLDQLPSTYMYSVIFKEIILEIGDDEKQMRKLLDYCSAMGAPDDGLKYFENQYNQKSPIWWYTCELFLYGMLNKALRSLDMEGMVKMGFFIRHLHLQLEQLHKKQSVDFTEEFIVYRGQGLIPEDFQNLSDSVGGLLSFNNFLSTSQAKIVAKKFVENSMRRDKNVIGVLFIITIDPTKISTTMTPFALIDKQSAISSEQEILFTMHTVFRVISINQPAMNNRFYEVQLSITDKNDPHLAILTNQIKKEVQAPTGWYRMGQLMLKVGHLNQAEDLYNELLKDASDSKSRAHIYNQIAAVKSAKRQYIEAVSLLEESLKIKLESVSEDDISLASTYHNIATVHMAMKNYEQALEIYQKARKIKEKSLPADDPDLAITYSNIGGLYSKMGDQSKALEFYEKSLVIAEKTLPSNHPALATYYLHVGEVHNRMDNHSKTLEFYNKAIEIFEKVLPSNHSLLAASYRKLGVAYMGTGELFKGLEYIKRSMNIQKESTSSEHLEIEGESVTIKLPL